MRLDLFVDGAALVDRAQPKLDKLRKATQDMEAVFLKDLLSAMRRTVPENETESGFGSEIYKDMLDQALAEASSKSGSMGIAKLVFERMAPVVVAQEKAQQLLQADQTRNR